MIDHGGDGSRTDGSLAKRTAFLTELGVIDDASSWIELGFIHPLADEDARSPADLGGVSLGLRD